MEIALFVTIVLGLIAVLLSWDLDKLKKLSQGEKKAQKDKIYKLSVLKEIQEKIAYETETAKVIDIIMVSLRNFYAYSAVSSMVIKDADVILKVYVQDNIGNEYIKKVEESMLSSFEKLIGKLPFTVEKKFYGLPLNDAVKSTYSSSFHIPLIANNRVLALIHLSSTSENAYKDMTDLHELIDAASSCLTRFNRALDTQTEKFVSLVESISDGIFMVDNKNNLLIINDSAKKFLGVNREYVSFLDAVNAFSKSPPSSPRGEAGGEAGLDLASKIQEVTLSKNPYFEKEIAVNNKVFNIFINPIAQDKISVVLHDMTDYKKKEMLKEDLTHIMVHELRAPVTTIKDSAELIISTKDLEEDKKLKFLKIIHQQAKKILGQIASILDTAKLDAGKLVLQKSPGDISKLIQDEIQTFMPQAQRKNISLSFDIVTKSLPKISFDEIRISQVIDNLLSNSLKFTPEGGKIKVEVDYKVIPPTEKFLSLDKYIVISVSDTGVGITHEQQKLLFSKYTQAKNTSEEVATQGTGLGLYLVKGIVESHGGRVWVKSIPGRGTTMSFTLPSSDDDVAQKSYDEPKPPPLSQLSQTVN